MISCPAEATLADGSAAAVRALLHGTLIDLVVLGLFAEYSDKVHVDSFTTTRCWPRSFCNPAEGDDRRGTSRAGPLQGEGGRRLEDPQILHAWVILFGSKFVILEALSFAFGETVRFEGSPPRPRLADHRRRHHGHHRRAGGAFLSPDRMSTRRQAPHA
jgi:hypothetical protein